MTPGGRVLLSIFVSFSIAALFTAVFAFRFRNWGRPWLLVSYCAAFMALEWTAAHFFLPPGVFGVEVALVCLFLTALFVAIIVAAKRFEEGRR